MARVRKEVLSDAYSDLYEPKVSIIRLRQLRRIIHEQYETDLWPLALVNVATCVEWFARTIVKHLIDFSADRINPDAKILRDLKLNYALVLQAHVHRFSIGDIVATSRNFSSFDEIEETLNDLMKDQSGSPVAALRNSWANLMSLAVPRWPIPKKAIARELNSMFRKRNELVHGTPRHLAFEDQLEVLVSRQELLRFIYCALEYMRRTEVTLRRFIPELDARSTHQMNRHAYDSFQDSEAAISNLETAIERRLANEADQLSDFRKAQRAWRLWRGREALFQTSEWGFGSGRTAVLVSYETSFNMERLRSLEGYLRRLDDFGSDRLRQYR